MVGEFGRGGDGEEATRVRAVETTSAAASTSAAREEDPHL